MVPRYRWTSEDGKQSVGNLSIVEVKARVNRKGGSYAVQ